ncbi:MAG: heavy metal transport/detoxification protein [Bacteroides sp.]|nr:heavy metal transport/detoxification protein [Bacteroides sp.]
MKFKTNAKCGGCSAAILGAVRSKFPNQEWSLDLDSADKVLEMHGVPDDAAVAAQVEKTVAEAGFNGSWLRQGDNNL